MAEAIGDEFATAVLETMHASSFTSDSTPLQASRYNTEAALNPHYSIRMDKSHILMADGYPLYQIHSSGVSDNSFVTPLIDRLPPVGGMAFYADGGYDTFRTYTSLYMATGAAMEYNHGTNALHHGIDEDEIRRNYARMWRLKGYDPHRRNDPDFMLRFLCRLGEEVLVGQHLRDRSMLLVAEVDGERRNVRQVCETVHRDMKRWVVFSIFRLVKRTNEARILCRFLCLQLLSVLFKGYIEPA